jgi:predicted dehydrogenase
VLNVAVVGMGWWGKTIVPLIRRSAKLKVAKVVELNPAAIYDYAHEHHLEVVADFQQILHDPTIQGVVLCTPHTQHTDQIVAAAGAGKHVFCEKPLSMTRADVLRAVETVNRHQVVLAVGHERRFEPPIMELMRIVKSGELGTPLQVEANFNQDKFLTLPPNNWRLSSNEAPAGPMTATGIHLLDLSIGVFGPARHVYASVKQLGSALVNGDTLAILASFQNGGHALISAILATPFDGRFAVYCNKGWIEVRDKSHPEAPRGWVLTRRLRGGERSSVEYPPADNVLANLEAFADAAAGRAPYPIPQEQMIANISALEAIFKSAKSGAPEPVAG